MSSNFTASCRKTNVTFDPDRYPVMLGIKIDYKSVYGMVEAGAVLHCKKMLPAAKMVQPRFIHKILREYVGGAWRAGLSVTRFIYKPGKGRVESGKQG